MEESEGEKEKTSGILEKYRNLQGVVTREFPEITENSNIERGPGDAPRNLRIFFKDDSFIDIRVTQDNDYSFHWQRGGKFIRFDNAPHHKQLETFPDHKHENDEIKKTKLAEYSSIEDKLLKALQALRKDHI